MAREPPSGPSLSSRKRYRDSHGDTYGDSYRLSSRFSYRSRYRGDSYRGAAFSKRQRISKGKFIRNVTGRPNPFNGNNISRSPCLLQTVLENGYQKAIINGTEVKVTAEEAAKYMQVIHTWQGRRVPDLDNHTGFVHMESAYLCFKRSGLPTEKLIDIWNNVLFCSPATVKEIKGRLVAYGKHSRFTVESLLIGLKLIQTTVRKTLPEFVSDMSYNIAEGHVSFEAAEREIAFSFNTDHTETRTVVRSQYNLPARVQAKLDQTSLNKALLIAAEDGDDRGVRDALNRGANINYQMSLDRITALYRAIESGKVSTVRLLLESGADISLLVNNKRNAEVNPLTYAVLTSGANPAFDHGIIDVLVSAGCDVNHVAKDLGTALHACVVGGSFQSCRMLLMLGASPHITHNVSGNTARELAKEFNLNGLCTLMDDLCPLESQLQLYDSGHPRSGSKGAYPDEYLEAAHSPEADALGEPIDLDMAFDGDDLISFQVLKEKRPREGSFVMTPNHPFEKPHLLD